MASSLNIVIYLEFNDGNQSSLHDWRVLEVLGVVYSNLVMEKKITVGLLATKLKRTL